MANVTVTTDDNYVIVLDADGDDSNPAALRVIWGDAEEQVWSLDSAGLMEVHGSIESAATFQFVNRDNNFSTMMQFDRGLSTRAKIDSGGRWICSSVRGFAVQKDATSPSDSPAAGATRTLYDSTGPTCAITGYVGGAWRSVQLL